MLPAIIAGGAALLGTAANAAATGNMNKKNRAFAREQYQTQKADNLDFWNQQNTYNSPQQQMARLQQAGLNPNLVYGNGSAANTAGDISTPHAQPFRGEAPQIDLPQMANSYFNAQTQAQNLSNQQKQGSLIDAQTALANAEVANKLFQNNYNINTQHIRRNYEANRSNKSHYDYQQSMQKYELHETLNELVLSRARADLANTQAGTNLRLQQHRANDLTYKADKANYDNQMGGMKPQDWIKLLLGATGQMINLRKR